MLESNHGQVLRATTNMTTILTMQQVSILETKTGWFQIPLPKGGAGPLVTRDSQLRAVHRLLNGLVVSKIMTVTTTRLLSQMTLVG